MKYRTIASVLIAAVLLLSSGLSNAVDAKSAAAGEGKPVNTAKTPDTVNASRKDSKAKPAKVAKARLVDINSAGKAELKTLPGISDAEADKIIAGRPYLSKANLVSHNVLERGVYENLKKLIIAKQKDVATAKPGKN